MILQVNNQYTLLNYYIYSQTVYNVKLLHKLINKVRCYIRVI